VGNLKNLKQGVGPASFFLRTVFQQNNQAFKKKAPGPLVARMERKRNPGLAAPYCEGAVPDCAALNPSYARGPATRLSLQRIAEQAFHYAEFLAVWPIRREVRLLLGVVAAVERDRV
jgi:hypothetical protein